MDSLEDRIYAAGKHDEFLKAHDTFVASKRTNTDQTIFYDKLKDLGANDEEADEFVNMVMENS
jgi:hypothetical protein